MTAIHADFTFLVGSMTIYQHYLIVSSTKSCAFLNNKSIVACIILIALLKKMIHVANSKRSIFYLLYGCLRAEFGSLSSGQSHSPIVNQCFYIQSLRHWDPHKVPKPDQVLCGV